MLQPVVRPLAFLGLAVASGSTAFAQIELPTPASHYEDYDPEKAAQTLMLQLAVRVPEIRRARAMELFERAKAGDQHVLSADEARELLEAADWTDFRPDLLRLLLHGSNVLDVVPTDYAHWTPLVHDALLLFLDRLSEARLIERVVAQANLPRDASRGARALAFIVNPNRKIFEARKRETAALGAGEKLVLGHPLAATIGDSARCMQNLEKVLFTGQRPQTR